MKKKFLELLGVGLGIGLLIGTANVTTANADILNTTKGSLEYNAIQEYGLQHKLPFNTLEQLLLHRSTTGLSLLYNSKDFDKYIIKDSIETFYTKGYPTDSHTLFEVDYEQLKADKDYINSLKGNPNLTYDYLTYLFKLILSSAPNYTIQGNTFTVHLSTVRYDTNELFTYSLIYDGSGALISYRGIYPKKFATDNRVFTKGSFTDVSGWSKEYIDKLKNKGIIGGANGKYNPNDSVTRGQFVAMLSRTIPFVKTNVKKAPFTDIDKFWAKEDITLLYEMGVATGYKDGKFKPNQPITREEAVVMIDLFIGNATEGRIAKNVNVSNNQMFSDEASITATSVESVKRIATLGIISGSNGKFDPNGQLKRSQMAKIISNMLDVKVQ